jgi:ATP-dependent RNA helicase DeaD
MTFQEMGLSPELLKSINDLSFKLPTPVQEKVIPLMLESNSDIIALAQTGTGKTAAFGLPILQKINLKSSKVQVLILCPTRELCIQISDDLIDFAKYLDNLKIVPVYGGSSIEAQIRGIKHGAQIIVATPGRLIDLIERKVARLDDVSTLILDEADEMLNMGFTESITTIMKHLPETRTNMLFSATMPPEIAHIAKKYMNKPMEITIGNKNSGAENIKHVCYTVHAKDKYATLKRIADYYPNIYGIIFCRTRIETQQIADNLIEDGFNAEPLHGDLSQAQRDMVMNKFRNKTVKLLVATDIAARGIDVNDLTHIINYNLPDEIDAYNHRSGRTGRAGKTGISIAIINMKEKFRIRLIEKKVGIEFEWEKVPSGNEVCEKQLFNLIEKIEHIEIEHSDIEPFLPIINKKLGWLDKEDLIKRLVSVEFNRILQYYRNAKDLNEMDFSDLKGRSKKERSGQFESDSRNYVKLFINLGKFDEFYPGALIEMLNKTNKGIKFNIGRIELFKKFTIFEIDNKNYEKVIKSLNGVFYDDRKLVVKVDDDNNGGSERSEAPRRRKKR